MEASEFPSAEQRRAPRIPSDLLVRIEGLDEDYRPARGNISSSGVLLELSSAPGGPGDLELLHLATRDFERRVDVLGQIVRLMTIDSIGDSGSRVAVAFEFLPDHPKTKAAIADLIAHVADHARHRDELELEHLIPVDIAPKTTEEAAPLAATVFRLHVEKMLLLTTWPVNVGDRVQLAFRPPGTRLPFEGLVSKVTPHRSRRSKVQKYEVEVQLGELGQKVRSPNGPPPADSIDLVLSEMLTREAASQDEATPRHLSGRLERIPITSLLTFLEMERQSGRISVDGGDRATLFIDAGRVVDVEPSTDDPVQQISDLVVNPTGRFDFTCETVERADRIGQSTTHLLLDLVRQQDERQR